MTQPRVTLVMIEDAEFEGTCGECGRNGLRWLARLSDGTAVGTECAKAILGYKPAPKMYAWVPDYRPVATHVDYGVTYVLWRHKSGTATRETRNGHLSAVGAVPREWERRGWPTA